MSTLQHLPLALTFGKSSAEAEGFEFKAASNLTQAAEMGLNVNKTFKAFEKHNQTI